jgi:hypothetical protein
MAPTPYLSWLDHSEIDRRKALDIIGAIRTPETVDELGIGVVRDAFADMLFPGTSTAQTRARYFLFVPWTYLDLERRRIPSAKVAAQARRAEVKLIFSLLESGEPDGVIGRESKAALKRLPSDIYWSGLGSWGIRLFPGTREQYHRYLDRYSQSARATVRTDDGEPAEGSVYANWHPGLPSPPADFPGKATLRLSKAEAHYLKDRIVQRHPRTLLAFLVSHGRSTDGVVFPWFHPQYAQFPLHVVEQLEHARCFSEVMHGAALLYNLMLSEVADLEEHRDDFASALDDWAEVIESRRADLREWDRAHFWRLVEIAGVRVPERTRRFAEDWIVLVLGLSSARRVSTQNVARDLVRRREWELKGHRARLYNEEAMRRWGGDSGSAQLTFRWPVTQRIVNDILLRLNAHART